MTGHATASRAATSPRPDPSEMVTVAIIGAGFAGIGAAVALERRGISDYLILERADEVGGTWRDNVYPGCACDIPSHLYSLSFEPKSDWSCKYPSQPEIWDYLRDIVDRRGLRRRMWTGAEVVSCRFDEFRALWRLETADGRRLSARTVIAGLGALRDPKYPSIEGMDRFGGDQMHTARWDPDVDLSGRRVGVVGTGASAIQVIPEAARTAAHVTVFQRTPAWVVPRRDRPYTRAEQWAFEHVPGARRLHRAIIYVTKELRYLVFDHAALMRPVEGLVKRHLRRHVRDPRLAAVLEPDYRMGCKRVLVSDDYYRALARDDVEVVTDPIARVDRDGIVTQDGTRHDLDVIVWATGFDVGNPLGRLGVTGLDGRDLEDYWGERPTAYLGTTVPGFPNLFLMLGPNTGLGHNSVVLMIESQLNYVIGAIARLSGHDEVAYVDVRPAALEQWEDEVARRTRHSVWGTGCDSWYLGPDGHNFTLWPGSTAEYRLRTRRFDARNYRLVRFDELPARRAESVPA